MGQKICARFRPNLCIQRFAIWFFLSLVAAFPCISYATDSFIQSKAYSIDIKPAPSTVEAWTPYEGILDLGYGPQPVWIKLKVAPLAGQSRDLPIELNIRPYTIDQIDLYDPLINTAPSNSVGEKTNWFNNARPSFSNNFVIPAGSTPRDILLRMKTSSARLVEITALTPAEIIPWERSALIQSNFVLFTLVVFFAWASYNGLIYRDALIRSFALLQLTAVFYGISALGFVRVFLSDVINPEIQEWIATLSVFAYSTTSIWFYKKLISTYPVKEWTTFLLRVLLISILPIITIYFMSQSWLSLMLNAWLMSATCLALLAISLWGIRWHTQQDNPFLLPKKILNGYFLLLVALNIFQLTALHNFNVGNVLTIYGSITYAVLNGLLITIMMVKRSRSIAKSHQQRIIAEARRLENEQQQRALQSQFVDMLAHELKTPLSVISLAIDSQAPSDKLKHLANHAITSMKEVIARCHQETRLTNIHFKPHFQLIDVNPFLAELIENTTDSQRISFLSDYFEKILTDKELLTITVNNLLDNAIKYGNKTGYIDVELFPDSDKATLNIAIYNDIGPAGIPNHEHVFQKYYRSDSAHRETGSGLGLYLSKKMIEMHNGTLKYAVVNRRICFMICLPLAA